MPKAMIYFAYISAYQFYKEVRCQSYKYLRFI